MFVMLVLKINFCNFVTAKLLKIFLFGSNFYCNLENFGTALLLKLEFESWFEVGLNCDCFEIINKCLNPFWNYQNACN